jgi:hypothetical protein
MPAASFDVSDEIRCPEMPQIEILTRTVTASSAAETAPEPVPELGSVPPNITPSSIDTGQIADIATTVNSSGKWIAFTDRFSSI